MRTSLGTNGTLDDFIGELNTYYWGPLQYSTLSTNSLLYMTESDWLKARMRHWLGLPGGGTDGFRIDTLSVQRDPSQDGLTAGQLTFYDYLDKDGPYPLSDPGGHILPAVVAKVLPDGLSG